jgi:hypothetical protein
MHTDIRLPIGLLFTIIGVVITVYGCLTNGAEMYKHSLGININVWSGIFILAFGVIMLALAMKGKKTEPPKQ